MRRITWAKQLSQILKEALIRAKQERQPQFLQRQGAISLAIMLTVAVANWLLTKLRWRIHPTKTRISDLSTTDTAPKKQGVAESRDQSVRNKHILQLQVMN